MSSFLVIVELQTDRVNIIHSMRLTKNSSESWYWRARKQ